MFDVGILLGKEAPEGNLIMCSLLRWFTDVEEPSWSNSGKEDIKHAGNVNGPVVGNAGRNKYQVPFVLWRCSVDKDKCPC